MFNATAFFSYVLLCSLTPGPANILALANATKYGLKRASRFCFGACLGVIFVSSISAVFVTALFNVMPKIEPALAYIGAAYILWLAYKTYSDKGEEEDEADGLAETGPESGITERKTDKMNPCTIRAGLLLQFVNVKLLLYQLSLYSTFIIPFFKSPYIIGAFIVMLGVIGGSANFVWALGGSIFQSFYNKHRRPVNIVLALMLVYCALSIMPFWERMWGG